MKIKINGGEQEIPDGLSVRAMLDHLGMNGARVAIERNLEILPRSEWTGTSVRANDSFEIVHFVGGG
jgi:sulfur carrier protein